MGRKVPQHTTLLFKVCHDGPLEIVDYISDPFVVDTYKLELDEGKFKGIAIAVICLIVFSEHLSLAECIKNAKLGIKAGVDFDFHTDKNKVLKFAQNYILG